MQSEHGLTLKEARERKGLKQAEAAEQLGISKDTLSNYERGKSYPDVPVIRKIEELYGIPYRNLLFLPLDYDKTVNFLLIRVPYVTVSECAGIVTIEQKKLNYVV